MSDIPTHFGAICLLGAECAAQGVLGTTDRSLADFFKIAIGPDGGVVATFDDNGRTPTPAEGGPPAPYVVAVRQLGGLGMTAEASRRAQSLDKAPGEAPYPPHNVAGRNVPQLEFTSMPSLSRSAAGLRISFSLGDVRTLTNALVATDSGVATDAYWLVMWKAHERVEYAGMHVDRLGTPDFFGGTDPVPIAMSGEVGSPTFASYPSSFTLHGKVDPRSTSVTIDIPRGTYHLASPRDLLHSLQAFSMTGTLTSIYALPLQEIDSTPPETIRS